MLNKEKITEDLKQAMLSRDELKTSVLRMLKAEIMKVETDGSGREINEELIIDLVKRLVKQRKDSSEQFKNGGRVELAAKEEAEIKILETYMPAQMNEDEVRIVVKETMVEMGVSDKSGMGKIMGSLMGKLKGKADGTLVKQVLESELK